jgi:hypothetical protein
MSRNLGSVDNNALHPEPTMILSNTMNTNMNAERKAAPDRRRVNLQPEGDATISNVVLTLT